MLTETSLAKSSAVEPSEPVIKSFEQFLLEKVEMQQTKHKIIEDITALATRKNKHRSPRRPLADRMASEFN